MLFLIFISLAFANEQSLEIVSYNVENLFNAKHDANNFDFEFLPKGHPFKMKGCKKYKPSKRSSCKKLDWNESKVLLKISQIKKAIGFPDILALVEIENESVAKSLGYSNYILSEKHDVRGIRTSIFFKKGKILRKREIPVKNSRSILEVTIDFKDFGAITFFVNHWPSQNHKDGKREEAASLLLNRIKKISGEKIIVMGDFNLDSRFENNSFFDSEILLDLSAGKPTYFFIPERKWYIFDRILISENLKNSFKNYRVIKNRLIGEKFILKGKEVLIPKPYNFETRNPKFAGFSDHFPVKLSLINRKKLKSGQIR